MAAIDGINHDDVAASAVFALPRLLGDQPEMAAPTVLLIEVRQHDLLRQGVDVDGAVTTGAAPLWGSSAGPAPNAGHTFLYVVRNAAK